MTKAPLLALAFFIALVGCAPKVRVTKNPCDNDPGIRYYRPKPYLLITPAGSQTVTKTTDDKNRPVEVTNSVAGSSDQFVQIQLQYLPDYSEEYAINVRPGLGNATVDVSLQNGWNLTNVKQELDTQFDENLTAVSGLVRAVTGASVPAGGPPAPGNPGQVETTVTQKSLVQATNIPLGYYESVIGRDNAGRKQMYGWRYLGFLPYQRCPIEGMNSEVRDCKENCLYGLVFEQGVMRFKEIGAIERGESDGRIQRVLVTTDVTTKTTKVPDDVTVPTPPPVGSN